MEELVRTMFKEAIGVDLADPFPIMTFADADARLRSDSRPFRVPHS